jgi:hypothetical protein
LSTHPDFFSQSPKKFHSYTFKTSHHVRDTA